MVGLSPSWLLSWQDASYPMALTWNLRCVQPNFIQSLSYIVVFFNKLYMNIWASYGKMISQTTGSLDFSMPPAQGGHSRPKVAQGPSYTCSAFRSTCSQLVGVSHHFWLPKIIWIKWLPKKSSKYSIILVGWVIGNLIPPGWPRTLINAFRQFDPREPWDTSTSSVDMKSWRLGSRSPDKADLPTLLTTTLMQLMLSSWDVWIVEQLPQLQHGFV